MFGYFFGPKRDVVPALEELAELRPDAAVHAVRFYDDSLRAGAWPRIGRAGRWSRDAWPMPAFVTGSGVPDTPHWRVVCDEDDPNREVETIPIARDEADGLLPDVVSGEGAVEARLTQLLDPAGYRVGPDDDDAPREAVFYLYFPSQTVAEEAVRELEREALAVRVEGPLDEPAELPFLVLATRTLEPGADVAALEELMERVADRHGGDYDGLERPVA